LCALRSAIDQLLTQPLLGDIGPSGAYHGDQIINVACRAGVVADDCRRGRSAIAAQVDASATMNGDWLPDEAPARSLCGRMVAMRLYRRRRAAGLARLSGLTSAFESIRR
jgi:hypothetical protein